MTNEGDEYKDETATKKSLFQKHDDDKAVQGFKLHIYRVHS